MEVNDMDHTCMMRQAGYSAQELVGVTLSKVDYANVKLAVMNISSPLMYL